MSSLEKNFLEKNKWEQKLYDDGITLIAGVDEVGRGPLAGIVTVAAVILDPNKPIYGLRDSKKLSRKQIKTLANEIKQKALCYEIVSSNPPTIDKYGISNVIRNCMKTAVFRLEQRPQYVLVDYEKLNFQSIKSISILNGDDMSNSIAAASILAKDYRDQKMIELAAKYPQYSFETNVGYGTVAHKQVIEKYGPIPNVHRYTFKPIRKE